MSGAPIRPKRSSAKATADKINASLKAEGAKIGEQRTEPPPHCYAGSQDALQNAKKRLKQIKVLNAEPAPKAGAKTAKSSTAGKRPVATISLLDDDDDGPALSAGKRPLTAISLPTPKAKRVAPSKAAAAGAGADNAADAGGAAYPKPGSEP